MESYIGEGDEEEIDEGEVEGGGEVEGDEGMEDDGDENDADERTPEVGSLGSPGSGHARSFILPQMWTVNDFLLKMTTNIFKNLKDHYQIPNHIPIHLPRKYEKCYSGKTAGMYDAMFAAGLRLVSDMFFWCYRPQHIVSSQGIYHFATRKKALRLMSDMLDSNRN